MGFRLGLIFVAFVALLAPESVRAQVVHGSLTTPDGRPMYGAMVTLVDSTGTRRAGGFSDVDGRFVIRAPGPGRFSVRAELVGRITVTSAPRDLAAGDSVFHAMVGGERSNRLADVHIIEHDRCVTRPQGGVSTAALWEEAAKALRAASFVEESRMLRFRTENYTRLRSTKRNYRRAHTDTVTLTASRPFATRTPAELASEGYVERAEEEIVYHAPDHASLLSDEFVGSHCFFTRAGTGADRDLIGLAFEPVEGREKPDVRGVFWMTRTGGELRRLDYSYTGLDPAYTMKDGGGRLEFRRLPTGAWIVSKWWIRMPVVNMPGSLGPGRPRKPDVVAINEAGGRVLQTLPPRN